MSSSGRWRFVSKGVIRKESERKKQLMLLSAIDGPSKHTFQLEWSSRRLANPDSFEEPVSDWLLTASRPVARLCQETVNQAAFLCAFLYLHWIDISGISGPYNPS